MKHCLAAIGFILLVATFSYANSWTEDDSRYVSLGPRNGYYIVRPDSPLFHKLGLFEAPWIDTASALQRGGYATDPDYASKVAAIAASVDSRSAMLEQSFKSASIAPITPPTGIL